MIITQDPIREARKANRRQHYQNNRLQYAETHRRYVEANHDKVKAYQKAYRALNRLPAGKQQ